MKILLHICCAPCLIYPLKALREKGYEITGLFYNPNIHPYQEYLRRAETLLDYAKRSDLSILWAKRYEPEKFLKKTLLQEEERCLICYTERLEKTVKVAAEKKFGGFTTTLLYSKYQKHELIKEIAAYLAKKEGIPFLYLDFREGWEVGQSSSRQLQMYRQSYCGCIFSEKERYYSEKKLNERFPPLLEDGD